MAAKTALVTGASGGIGSAVALHLARQGWKILAQGRNETALSELVSAVEEAGGEGAYFQAEMGDMQQLAALSEWAGEEEGLDAFIHCAGSYAKGEIGLDSFAAWDQVIDEIIRGTMRLSAMLLPSVTKRQGAFVFICGPSSWMGMKGHSGYCVARHAQAGFARTLFEEVRELGVRVSLVHPGFVNTGLVNQERLDPERMIQADDIAEIIGLAVNLPNTACITELTVRPQRSPYR